VSSPLKEEYIQGSNYVRIGRFIERRLLPSIRSCQAALIAQRAVSQEIQDAANLIQAGLILKRQKQEHKIKLVVDFLHYSQ
jgi:uncharacterized membrane-anchored protein